MEAQDYFRNAAQVWVQTKAVLITIAYSAVATAVVYKISALITSGGRIEENLELEGMDIGYHGEQHLVVEETHVVASIKAKKK